MVAIFCPPPFIIPAQSGPTSYSFTMTAGSDGGGNYGYLRGDPSPDEDIGSLSNQPVPGQILGACIGNPIGTLAQVIFAGDIKIMLTGKHLFVDSVDYGAPQDIGSGPDWTVIELDVDEYGTVGMWQTPLCPAFGDEGVYFVEIK